MCDKLSFRFQYDDECVTLGSRARQFMRVSVLAVTYVVVHYVGMCI